MITITMLLKKIKKLLISKIFTIYQNLYPITVEIKTGVFYQKIIKVWI